MLKRAQNGELLIQPWTFNENWEYNREWEEKNPEDSTINKHIAKFKEDLRNWVYWNFLRETESSNANSNFE